MNRKSDRTGAPRLSMLMLISAVVLAMAAVGFILVDSGDIPDSEGATSGTCGDDLTWTIDSEGNLKIEGSGPMYDFTSSSTKWGGNTVKSVVIGDSVASIGNRAFYGCTTLTSVAIGKSVTSIGDHAFDGCSSLTSIAIPDSVISIGQSVFQGCTSLGSAIIGDSVGSVPWQAFDGCTSLISVVIGDSAEMIEEFAFSGCTSLTSVTIPDSVISIGSEAFDRCTSLKSIILGDSVEIIEEFAFQGCTSLTSVTIPDSVGYIGTGAFYGCTSLTGFVVNGYNAYYSSSGGILYDKDKTMLIQYPAGRTDPSFSVPSSVIYIWECAFSGSTSLTTVTIPDSVGYIGGYAFYGCTSLASVAIDAAVEEIMAGTFGDCTSLGSIDIPDSVTTIVSTAFGDCTSLTAVTIPDSVETIEEGAFFSHVFYDMDGVTVLEQTASNLAGYTFEGETVERMIKQGSCILTFDGSELKVTLDGEVLTSPAEVDRGSMVVVTAYAKAGYTAQIMAGTTVIADGSEYTVTGDVEFKVVYTPETGTQACGDDLTWTIDSEGNLRIEGSGPMYDYDYTSVRWGGNEVRSVEIGDSVTSIGDRAFYACYSLTSVTIGDSVTTIGESAFSNCISLVSIDIPDSATYIGDWAVYACSSITAVTIGNSVTFIGEGAFSGCDSLTEVFIPGSVTWIGDGAFCDCASLISIEVDASNTVYCSMDGVLYNEQGTILFQYPIGRADSSFSVPSSVTLLQSAAFSWCASLESIDIPDSVECIWHSVFFNCTSLTSVTIPDSVNRIGKSVFDGCSSLVSIEVADHNQNYRSVDGVLYSKDMTKLLKYPIGKADDAFQIPDSITFIEERAFSQCTSLTSVTIPDSVTSIGEEAFNGCTSLTSVTIPDSITSIERWTFFSCDSLASVTIPDSVISIGDHAFYACSALTSLTIPDSVISIGEWTFAYCTSLTAITIPDSVTTIEERAFSQCTSLISVTIPDSVISIGDHAFYECIALTTVIIPDSVISIEHNAFGSHVFYDTDGVTVLEPTASNLAGHTFEGETVNRMIKQGSYTLTFTETDGVIYKLDGETVSGTVEGVQEGTVLTIELEDGYTGTPIVRIGGVEVDLPYSVVEGGVVTVAGIGPAGIFVVVFDPAEVEVTAGGERIGSFARVVGGTEVAIAPVGGIDGTIYVNGKEYSGAFELAGDVLITFVEDEPEQKYSAEVLVYVGAEKDGSLSVMLYAKDGNLIPAGTVAFTLDYSYQNSRGRWMTDSYEVTVEVEGGESVIFVDAADADTDFTAHGHYKDVISVSARFVSGDLKETSSTILYQPVVGTEVAAE